MKIAIDTSWKQVLQPEFEKDYFIELSSAVENAYLGDKSVYPSQENIFEAFKLCPFEKVKVVILGQDPYHKEGQAHGLSFSVPEGVSIPPSLKNIFKELESDTGKPASNKGDLTHWAKQGVLLLNATLTVQEGRAGSHQKIGWELFTDEVIRQVSEKKEHVVFLLWGKYAQSKESLIDTKKHLILKAPHPSPFSAYTGFFGCKHFSKTNEYLKIHNQKEINW